MLETLSVVKGGATCSHNSRYRGRGAAIGCDFPHVLIGCYDFRRFGPLERAREVGHIACISLLQRSPTVVKRHHISLLHCVYLVRKLIHGELGYIHRATQMYRHLCNAIRLMLVTSADDKYLSKQGRKRSRLGIVEAFMATETGARIDVGGSIVGAGLADVVVCDSLDFGAIPVTI